MTLAVADEVAYGDVSTRQWVVDTILDLVGYTPGRDLTGLVLVEPSVGSGAFLGPIVDRLTASAIRFGVPFEALTGAIRGYDLQRGHVESSRARVVSHLDAVGVDHNVAAHLASVWIRHADFLLDDVVAEADFVVGNPPYIRFDDLDSERVRAYRSRWLTMSGRVDIYVGFFERALGLLRSQGKLGFICADRWMRNAYGARLRSLISGQYAVETLWQMHDVDAFETDVAAYPAIAVLGNHRQAEVTVLDTTSGFGAAGASEATEFVRSRELEASGQGWVGGRLSSWFSGSDFWPAGGPCRIALLEHLQENFAPLEETGGDTVIGIGVATGADKAYLVPPGADVEPDRLLPIVMADDIRTGELTKPGKVLINPWDAQGQLVDIDKYPRMELALAQHEAVQNRFVARRNPAGWYRTIDKIRPGVAQRPKLLLQDMKAQITPVYEPGGLYPHHNLYYIVSTGWDLEVLGGLLLSRIAEAFIEAYSVKMRGGTLRFQAQYLRKIRVPAPQNIRKETQDRLRVAFRNRDRDAATRAAEVAYGLPEGEL